MPEQIDDHHLDRLRSLAPDVDTDAALGQFRRRRAEGRSRPRWAMPAAAAVILLLVAVGIVGALVQADDQDVVAGPDGAMNGPGQSEEIGFELLAVEPRAAHEDDGARAAVSDDEYRELWGRFGSGGPAPAVDFEVQVVVSLPIVDDACPPPPEITRFERSGDTVVPTFENSSKEPCVLVPASYSYVVALDRVPLGQRFTMQLPRTLRSSEHRLTVDLASDPPTSMLVPATAQPDSETDVTSSLPDRTPTCPEIVDFAEGLIRTGIDYDYSASVSPAELYERSDIVGFGWLTGFLDAHPEDSRVGYEVEVDALYKSPPGADLTTAQTFWIDHSPAIDPEQFRTRLRPDIPVVFFAEHIERDGETMLMPGPEGFMTACPGGEPLGFTGSWPNVATLDQLVARLEELAGS